LIAAGAASVTPDWSVITGPPTTGIWYTLLFPLSSHSKLVPSLAMPMTLLVVVGCARTKDKHCPLWQVPARQLWPHVPQFAGSLWTSPLQAPSASVDFASPIASFAVASLLSMSASG